METLAYSHMNTPVGRLTIAVSGRGVAMLSFGHALPSKLGGKRVEWRESHDASAETRKHLTEYFAG